VIPFVVGRRPPSAPLNWGRYRMKNLTGYLNRGVAPSYAEATTGMVAFSQKCVRADRTIDVSFGRPMTPEDALSTSDARLGAGDLVINSTGTGTLGRVGLIAEPDLHNDTILVADGHVTIARAHGDVVAARFLWYLLQTDVFYEFANACLSVGATNQTELGREPIRRLGVALPSVDEQQALVEVLDREALRIDALISEQVGFEELLAERRSAAVFDAVTGRSVLGHRRTDVPWVESVPGAWNVSKLLRVAQLGSGHTPARNRPELWEDCTIPWITTGEVWQIRSDVQEVLTETREMISEAGVAESAAAVHRKGTVVLCRTAASAGYSAIMGLDMATSQDFATWTCGPELEPHFLLYCLRAMRRDLLQRLALGSTHRTIYMPEIKSIVVPVPEIDEQRAIVADLREELERIDRIREEINAQIALLREHRQALITVTVTGTLQPPAKTA
jgi:type I restriction enzyme S subunit